MGTSRREFLKFAGLITGAATVSGAGIALANSKNCGPISSTLRAHCMAPVADFTKKVSKVGSDWNNNPYQLNHDYCNPHILAKVTARHVYENLNAGALFTHDTDVSEYKYNKNDFTVTSDPRYNNFYAMEKVPLHEQSFYKVCLAHEWVAKFYLPFNTTRMSTCEFIDIYIKDWAKAIAIQIDNTIYQELLSKKLLTFSWFSIWRGGVAHDRKVYWGQDDRNLVDHFMLTTHDHFDRHDIDKQNRHIIMAANIDSDVIQHFGTIFQPNLISAYGFKIQHDLAMPINRAIAFHPKRIAFVTRPLARINKTHTYAHAKHMGFTLRCDIEYDAKLSAWLATFSVLGGLSILDKNAICVGKYVTPMEHYLENHETTAS